jgi:hypothetical protein
MTQPNLILNFPAMIAAIVAGFVLGGLWYGPLFGKTWAACMGWKPGEKPEPGVVKRAMILQVVGLILTVWVLAHTCQVWRPSVWGQGPDGPAAVYGFFCGLFTWLGFYVPMQLGKISWEGRPWKLFFINTGHDFVTLQIMSQILAHWR